MPVTATAKSTDGPKDARAMRRPALLNRLSNRSLRVRRRTSHIRIGSKAPDRETPSRPKRPRAATGLLEHAGRVGHHLQLGPGHKQAAIRKLAHHVAGQGGSIPLNHRLADAEGGLNVVDHHCQGGPGPPPLDPQYY